MWALITWKHSYLIWQNFIPEKELFENGKYQQIAVLNFNPKFNCCILRQDYYLQNLVADQQLIAKN